MARRRLKRRQQVSNLKRPFGVMQTVAGVVKGYQSGKKLWTAAKAGLRHAKPAGRTKTTNQHGDWQVAAADSSGIKYKTVNINYKSSKIGKLTKALSEPGSMYDYTTGGIASGQGAQQAATVSSTVGQDFSNLRDALGGGVAVVAAYGASTKLLVSSVQHVMEFNNVGPTTAEMDVYIFTDKCTQPIASQAGAVWDSALAAEASILTGPLEFKTKPWLRPTTHKGFNIAYWTKSVKCSLTPGESCRLTVNFNCRRMLDTQYYKDFQAIRGITHQIVIVARGTLADSTKTLTVTANGQSLAPAKIVWMCKRTWRGSQLTSVPRVSRQIGNDLPTALANLWHQDEDGGAAEDAMLAANFA